MLIYTLGFLEKNSKVLLLLRQNTPFFSNHYGLPGGKIDSQESPQQALIRELHEELGLQLTNKNLEFVHCLSFNNENNTEVMALIFKILDCNQNPINKEPYKCSELTWFTYDNLPNNIIPRHLLIIQKIKQNILYAEEGW